MVTWNIDLSNYDLITLQDLLEVVECMDYSIAKEIQDYIDNTYGTNN